MFSVEMTLWVSGMRRRRAEHFAAVTDAFCELETEHTDIKDVAFGFTDDEDNDGRVDVQVNVTAHNKDAAYSLGSSAVRSAIHLAGGYTPDWDTKAPPKGAVYRVGHESVELISA